MQWVHTVLFLNKGKIIMDNSIICSERMAGVINEINYQGPLLCVTLFPDLLRVKCFFLFDKKIKLENIKRVYTDQRIFAYGFFIVVDQKAVPSLLIFYPGNARKWRDAFNAVGIPVEDTVGFLEKPRINLMQTIAIVAFLLVLSIIFFSLF